MGGRVFEPFSGTIHSMEVTFNLFHMNCEKHETFKRFIIILNEINTVCMQ